MATVKDLKKGEWFTLKPVEEPKPNQVWVRDEYDRTTKTYICYNWDDVNRYREFKGNKEVYTEFTF